MTGTNGNSNPNGNEHPKGGRPLKEIRPAQVYKLARIGCTNVEIGTILECSQDTLVDRFSEYLRKGRETMRMSLRRMQYKAAQQGSHTMLIWLGKQYLNQRDQQYNYNFDLTKLSDEQLERIASGEDPNTVAASGSGGAGETTTTLSPETVN